MGALIPPHLPGGAQLVGSTLGILLLEQKKGKQNRTSRCNTTAFGCSVSDRSQAQQDGAVPYLQCSRGFPQVQILEWLERLPVAGGKLSNAVLCSDGSQNSLSSVLPLLAVTVSGDNLVSSTASQPTNKSVREPLISRLSELRCKKAHVSSGGVENHAGKYSIC